MAIQTGYKTFARKTSSRITQLLCILHGFWFCFSMPIWDFLVWCHFWSFSAFYFLPYILTVSCSVFHRAFVECPVQDNFISVFISGNPHIMAIKPFMRLGYYLECVFVSGFSMLRFSSQQDFIFHRLCHELQSYIFFNAGPVWCFVVLHIDVDDGSLYGKISYLRVVKFDLWCQCCKLIASF